MKGGRGKKITTSGTGYIECRRVDMNVKDFRSHGGGMRTLREKVRKKRVG